MILEKDFLKYMDIMLHGSPEEKAKLSFKMICQKGHKNVSYDDFRMLLLSIF